MSLAKGDRSLQEELDWALERLDKAGFKVKSKVRLLVDPKLEIMGYATQEGSVRHVVISEWALHSEMLGGLLLHELAHIYHAEKRSPSHRQKLTGAIITEFSKEEGLNEKETAYLLEGFSHLQNVMVDDIVFAAMQESERLQARRFFAGWLTEAPSGYPLNDAAALVRNAFAIASLRRHALLSDASDPFEAAARSRMLVEQLGPKVQKAYERVEELLEKSDPGWDEERFQEELAKYLDLLVSLLREGDQMEDLR